MRIILSTEKKTEKQWGKHKEKDTKERKIELMPKTRERPKQKKEEQLLINQLDFRVKFDIQVPNSGKTPR